MSSWLANNLNQGPNRSRGRGRGRGRGQGQDVTIPSGLWRFPLGSTTVSEVAGDLWRSGLIKRSRCRWSRRYRGYGRVSGWCGYVVDMWLICG